MDCSHHKRCNRRFNKLAAMLRDAKVAPEQGLRRGRSEANHNPRLKDRDFRIQPWTAGGNLSGIGLFVNTALASRLPFEVFDRIGHINFRSIDSCFHQSFVEQCSGGTDKWLALEVFLVPGLFPYKNHFGVWSALAKDRLRSALPKVASLAVFCRFLQRRDSRVYWKQ